MNIFVRVFSWTWISSPRTGSQVIAMRSGTVSNAIACSRACPTRKSAFSPNWGPISCSPTGSPCESLHGIERPGSPARQDGS